MAIGGWAAGAQGAGWPTFDVDVVIDVEEENLARVVAALGALDAAYDTLHRPPIRPDLHRVRQATGPQLFRTRFGRIDVLKEAGGETYATLINDAIELEQGGQRVLTASLEALLRMKRAANRAKDKQGIARIEDVIRQRRDRAIREMIEEGRRQMEAFAALQPVDALAFVADAPAKSCLANGARWTLLRILANRSPVRAMTLLKKLTPLALVTVKCLVESATEERVTALGDAIDAGDVERATTVLSEWLVAFRTNAEDVDAPERLAKRLVDLFASR